MQEQEKLPAYANADSLKDKYPQGVSWDIDIPETNLVELINGSIENHKSKTAINFMGKKMTYAELGRDIAKAAKGLQDMGVRKGSRVGLYMPNTPYYPIMFFAALSAGAVVVNYSPLYTEEELRSQIEDSGTEIMVTLDLKQFHSKVSKLQDAGVVQKMITCSLPAMLPLAKRIGFFALKGKEVVNSFLKGVFNLSSSDKQSVSQDKDVDYRALTGNGHHFDTPDVASNDLALLQYTGGTTGVAKGAMLTHRNLVANVMQIDEYFVDNPSRTNHDGFLKQGKGKTLSSIPFFHVFGMMVGMISSLKLGTELVILPNPRDIKQTLKAIHQEQPTLFPAVPRLIQAITEYPELDKYDLSSLENVISGGAPLTPNVLQAFNEAVGSKTVIKQGYGLSETSPAAASNPAGGMPIKNETVGLPYPATEIKIANPDNPDEILNIGELGEICIRGPQLMQGYYNKPEETDLVMTKDGWLRTGDLGVFDENFYLKIVDRKKRMVIVNGHNAYPTQMENAICSHPAVAEAVVVGLPDDRSGEAAKAFIRYKDGVDIPTEDAMRAFLSQTLNKLDIPKFFETRLEELPKTSVGKPDYKALEKEELEKRAAQSIKKHNAPKIN